MEGVHSEATARNDRLHRGRSVALAFLMQGWGQLANQVALIVIMLIFNHSINPSYGEVATQATFRITFAIAALCLLYFLYLRTYKLKGVDQHLKASRQKGSVTGYDITSLKLVGNHYWHRLLATSVCWFCNDFPFYGNQIFRNVFLQIVTSSSDEVGTLWLYNLINIGCELV
jgi:MFS family permease